MTYKRILLLLLASQLTRLTILLYLPRIEALVRKKERRRVINNGSILLLLDSQLVRLEQRRIGGREERE